MFLLFIFMTWILFPLIVPQSGGSTGVLQNRRRITRRSECKFSCCWRYWAVNKSRFQLEMRAVMALFLLIKTFYFFLLLTTECSEWELSRGSAVGSSLAAGTGSLRAVAQSNGFYCEHDETQTWSLLDHGGTWWKQLASNKSRLLILCVELLLSWLHILVSKIFSHFSVCGKWLCVLFRPLAFLFLFLVPSWYLDNYWTWYFFSFTWKFKNIY